MDAILRRGVAAELLGTFAVVYFGAGAVCVNFLTTAANQTPATAGVTALQPGLVGIALTQGLIVAAALAVTVRLSGGFLNPAVTLMLWVFNRLDNKRTGLFLLAQLAGAVLAGGCLRFTFADDVLKAARLGTPHLQPLAFPDLATAAIIAGTAAELVLTFFLVFAIFGMSTEGSDPSRAALPAGLVLVAGALVLGPLTGAAANPARWLGTVVWEQMLGGSPWNDTFVYLAGPILGALAGGLVTFRFLLNESPLGEPALTNKAPAPALVKRK
jgi:glycerol uptake facilitator protein